MDWVSGVLAVVCALVALLHLARLVVHAGSFGDVPGGPAGEVSHAVMALGMVAMFVPALDPLPAPVWTVAFVLCGAWFAAVALRARSFAGDAGHHVVGSAAMVFMVATHHNGADAAADVAHAGHHGAAGGGMGLTSVVAIVLAGYFAWHALRCSDRLRVGAGCAAAADPAATEPALADAAGLPDEPGTARTAVAQRVGVLRSPRTVALAHVAMAVAMTVMLLAMI